MYIRVKVNFGVPVNRIQKLAESIIQRKLYKRKIFKIKKI